MTPGLSIVVAVPGGVKRLPPLLDALRSQAGAEVELLVCFPKGEPTVAEQMQRAGDCVAVEGAADALTPHLWRDGILRARAPRVALTTVHLYPSADWVERLLDADLDSYVAIGGAIDNEASSDALGWAVYLLRYIKYARPFASRETTDLAADNALYDREALLAHADLFEDGFWEPRVHARLAAEGRRLLLDPGLVSFHTNAYTTREFMRQRLDHGRTYGRDRGLALSRAGRWFYALASPAAGLVLGCKVIARALRRPGVRAHLPRALPRLCLFLAAWGLGEARGAFSALPGPGRP